MRSFAQKPEATQEAKSASSAKYSRVVTGQSHGVSLLQLQRTTGNQALQRLLHSKTEGRKMDPMSNGSNSVTHDFSQIPVFAHTHTNSMCTSEDQGDKRVQVQRPAASGTNETDVPSSVSKGLRSPGQPFDPFPRPYFGPRFGRDLGQMRQHIDSHVVDTSSISRLSLAGNPPLLLQAKLAMGRPGDRFEDEADRLARRIEGSADGNAVLNADLLQRSKGIPSERAAPQVEAWIHSRLGLGQPLTPAQRGFFEPRLGRDLGDTRIHADTHGAALAEGLGARAFTVGRDIFLGAGEFTAARDSGSRLLAHELVHVVQQNQAPAPFVQLAETDTRGQCTNLGDGAGALNAFVNQQIGNAVAAAASPTGRSTLPRRPNPMNVVEGTYLRLGAPVPMFSHLTLVGDWVKSNLPNRGGGYFPSGHRYSGASGTYLRYLAPAVNLNGHCVGIDKIDHMFQQGYQYFLIWLRTVNQFSSSVGPARASQAGEAFARGWGEWTEGQLSAATQGNPAVMTWLRSGMIGISGLPPSITGAGHGSYGLAATGVHSRGDLTANAAGLRFYRDLLTGRMGRFDIGHYITAAWDEEVSGNIFRHDVGAAVRGRGRLNPRDRVLPAPGSTTGSGARTTP